MHALPIFGITGRSLWFVVANLFSLFRLSWLPLAMLIATTYGMAYAIVELSPGQKLSDIEDGGNRAYLFATLTEVILNGIVLSVIAVNVHRIILFDDRRPNVYFAFPFGLTELLYVVMGTLTYFFLALLIGVIAYIYFILLSLAPQGAALLIAAMVEAAKEAAPTVSPWMIGITYVTVIVGYILGVWLMLRLTVWPPAVVANNRLSLGEALRLSKGRVFALLGLMIASILAYVAALFVFAVAIAIAAYGSAMAGESTIVALDSGTLISKVGVFASGQIVDPNAILFEFFYALTVTAYTVAILSYAYKALKGFDVDNAIDPLSTHSDPSLHMATAR
jgi:hypothetical protein